MALPPDLRWHDVREWGVEGKGWTDTDHYFDRLPARAKGVVRQPVWHLSHHATGMCVRFQTDASAIYARWTLRQLRDPWPLLHMTPVGSSGLDLYAQSPEGRWWWEGIGSPQGYPSPQVALVGDLIAERRAHLLYLPLADGVEALEIGVPPDAAFDGLPPRRVPPMAFYGTSIVHGAAATRPGMTHVAILGRRLGCPVLNLGFAGEGKMEPEVAALLAELEPCVYVVDCLPNMTTLEVAERAAPLVRTLRAARPHTPIVVVEDRTFANAALRRGVRQAHTDRRAALGAAYQMLLAEGASGLHCVAGERLLGDDGEATLDGSHPTDLGFMRMADTLEPILRPLI